MTKPKKPRKPRKPEPKAPLLHDNLEWGDPGRSRPYTWMWEEFIPRGCSVMIEGKKNTGKSSLMAAIAAAVTGGLGLPGWIPSTQGRVIWEPREEDFDNVVIPRLVCAGAHATLVARLKMRDAHGRSRKLTLPGDILVLEEAMREREVELLVLDPYSSVVGDGIDLRIPQQARMYAELVQELMIKLDAVCLMSRHVVKGQVRDARDAGMGSSEIGNVARVVIRCGEHPHEPGQLVASVVASNHAKRYRSLAYRLVETDGQFPRIEWLGEVSLTAEEVAAGRGDEAERDEWSAADMLLHALIGQSWCPVQAVRMESDRAGITPKMLQRAKARLKIPHRRVQVGTDGHWEWGPPQNGWPPGLGGPLTIP